MTQAPFSFNLPCVNLATSEILNKDVAHVNLVFSPKKGSNGEKILAPRPVSCSYAVEPSRLPLTGRCARCELCHPGWPFPPVSSLDMLSSDRLFILSLMPPPTSFFRPLPIR